jgi:putative ABC transport system permease protein
MTAWLFRRFVVRRWSRNPVRPLLMLVAVVLATTLWSAVLRTTFSGIRSFEASLGISVEDFPLVVESRGGRLFVSELSPCLSGLTTAFDMVAIRRESAKIVTATRSMPVRVIGVGGYGDLAGAENGGGDDGSTVRVAPELAHSLGLHERETVSLDFDGVVLDGRAVVSGAEGEGLAGHAVLMPLTVLARMSPEGAVDSVVMRSRARADPGRLRGEIAQWLEGCYRGATPLRIETAQSRVEQGERLLGAYRFNVFIMAVMTLLVCVLLVSQATHASLIAFSRELSILRTLGIGTLDCLWIVVIEAALIGFIGAVLGVTLGYPLTLRIASFLSGTAAEIYKLEMDSLGGIGLLLSELGVAVTIITVAVVGALMGGVQALKISPNVGTRRDFVHIKPLPLRVVLGVAALTLTAFVGSLVTVVRFPSLWSSYLFVGACVALVMGLTPVSLAIVPRLGTLCARGVVARLSSGGVKMSGRAYVLAAMGASVAVTLMVALTLMVESFRATLQSWTERRLQGDLFISSQIEGGGNEGRLPPSFIRDVASFDRVRAAVPYYESTTAVGGRSVVVGATDLVLQAEQGVYKFTVGAPTLKELGARDSCVISESAARKLSLSPGDTIPLEHKTFSVHGVFQEFGTEQPMVLLDQAAFLSLYPGHSPQSLIVYLGDAGATEAVRASIEARGQGMVVVRDQRELKDLVMYLFDRTFRVTGSVRWIVFGIGALGLVVSGLQLLWERRREVKTLVVIGVSPIQVIAWSVLEGALVSVGPFVLGVVMGTVMGWALTTFINPLSFGWNLEFSVSWSAISLAAVFVSCVVVFLLLMASLGVRRVSRTTALSDE